MPAQSWASTSTTMPGATALTANAAASRARAPTSMRRAPIRSTWRAASSALAAVPRPKAEAADMTKATETPSERATSGAIGPSTSELDPTTAMQKVST